MNQYVRCEYNTRNINSKLLLKHILSTICQTCDEYIIIRGSSLDRDYDYTQLASYMDLFMEDLKINNKVTRYTVTCDDSNNNRRDVSRGIIKASISYKQPHCFNTSNVDITFTIPS